MDEGDAQPVGWMPCPEPGCNYRYRLWQMPTEPQAPYVHLAINPRARRIHARYAHGYETD